MIGTHKVIDAHCHVYPDKIAERAVNGIVGFYHYDAAFDGTVGTLLDVMDANGIDQTIICSVATTEHQVHSINRYIADTVAAGGGRLIGLGALYPDSADIAGDVEELLALGLKGAKLHPDIQGFKLDDYRMLRIYEACEGRVPLLVHAGDSRYDYSNPNRFAPILETYTELKIVAAHFGGYSIWEEAVEHLPGFANLWVDCSSSLPFLTDEQALRIIHAYGADRVLFGSDYPLGSQPRELERVLSLGLSEEELDLIFHRNAEKVFEI